MTMADKKLFEGCLDNLPDQESSVVRVFLSSTFTDMSSERNEIMEKAVPELRSFCREKGLEFEICDMRWGVRDDASISHSTSDICLKELKNCQRMSRGPNFVAILGNKYGYCPYPAKLNEKEFIILHDIITEQTDLDVRLIDKWFKKDTNCTPALYILQPITDVLHHYDDMEPDNIELFEKDQAEWRQIDEELSRILHSAAETAFAKGLFSAEERHRYQRSITEHEVTEGILLAAEKKNKVMCFTRDIIDIDTTSSLAGKYIDMTPGGEIKERSVELLRDLKTQKLSGCLDEGELITYNIQWTPDGVNPDNTDHQVYLDNLREAFLSKMKDMIIASLSQQRSRGHGVYEEVLHHVHFCKRKCEDFQGRGQLIQDLQTAFGKVFEFENEEKVVGKGMNQKVNQGKTGSDEDNMAASDIEDSEEDFDDTDNPEERRQAAVRGEYSNMGERYKELGVRFSMEEYSDLSDPNKDVKMESLSFVKTSAYTKPLVVFGESGCGKTALMAKLANTINRQTPRPAWVARFLGTSPQSSSIRDTLISICHQIYKIYDLQPPQFDLHEDFPFLVQYFSALLWKVDSVSKPLYILLDSLDQLNPSDHAFSLNWLPTELPQNVHIVLSTLPEMHGLLTTLRNTLVDEELFFEVTPLHMSDASDLLLKVWSRSAGRQFTQPQRQLLKDKVCKGAAPLYLKLLFYQAVKWHSYTDITDVTLAHTAQAAINKLFDDLEVLHGKTLISHAFGYITAAKNGLSNQEMEHLLSLDNEVLQDVYLYHLPPNDQVITLPSLIWRRIVYDLGEYLVERRADGRTVKIWYHRQFHRVAEERYLTSADTKVKVHTAMVEYFMGVWSDKPKPLELYKMKTGQYPNSYRQVPDQPLLLGPSMFNLRKLTELPHHLTYSQKMAEFRTLIGCNLQWLYTKCKAVGLSETLDDLQVAVTVGKQMEPSEDLGNILADLQFVTDLLVLGNDNIRKNPINLPVQILGQLGTESQRSPAVQALVCQAQEWCHTYQHPVLVPQHPCLPSASGGDLKLTINTYVQAPGAFRNSSLMRSCLALREDTNSLLVVEMGGKVQNSDTLRTFDLEDGQCVSTCELANRICNIRLIDSNRYIHLEWTGDRDDYNPTCYHRLLSTSSSILAPLPKEISSLSLSPSLSTFAYAVGNDVFVRPCSAILKARKAAKEVKLSHADHVIHVIISSDDHYLVTTLKNNKQFVWELETNSCLHELNYSEKSFFSESKISGPIFHITKSNYFICPGLHYNTRSKVYVTNLETGEKVYEITGASTHYANSYVRMNTQESLLLLATRETSVINGDTDKWGTLWDLRSGRPLSRCSVVNGPYSEIDMFGDADHIFIVACPDDSPVINILWAGSETQPLREAILVRVLVAHNDSIIQVVLSQDKLISASKDNTVKVWDLKKIRTEIESQVDAAEYPESVKFCPSLQEGKLPIPGRDQIKTSAMVVCQNRAIVGSKDGFLIFHDLETSKQLGYIRPCSKPILSLLVTQDKQHIVAASPNKLFILEAQGDTVVREIPVPKVMNCLSEAGNIVVAGHGGMEAYGYAWNLITGKELGKFQGLYGFHCIAINSTGTCLAGSFFEYPVLYSVETGDMLTGLDNADVMMTSQSFLVFSPDDRYLAGGATDGSIRVVDGRTAKYLHRFQQLSSAIAGCFSPDSQTLVTTGFRTLFLWSLEKGVLLRSLTRHQDFVVKLKFCLDGRYLVSSSKDKCIIVWDWKHLYSVCNHMAHCPIDVMDVADDLTTVIYAPDSVDYVAILKPNDYMRKKLSGQLVPSLSARLQDAQAVALSFSSQALTRETTRACIIL